jgi:hypothetical protein
MGIVTFTDLLPITGLPSRGRYGARGACNEYLHKYILFAALP